MGLFDFFSGGPARTLSKHAARAANKRAQNVDRYDAIVALADLGTKESVEALLPRFGFRVDPSIVDQEEKEIAAEGCVLAGDEAIAPVKAFMASAKEISWPLKILEKLVPEDEVVSELLSLLGQFNTDYERDPTRKIQVIGYLEDRKDSRIAKAAAEFLEDMNDEVRFHAVRTMFAQQDLDGLEPLVEAHFLAEESARVRARIAEGYVARHWKVSADQRSDFADKLPDTFHIDADSGELTRV